MSYIHPDAAEHQRKRWLRHDAHRFAAPGSPEAETGLMHSWAEVARQEQAAADEAKARALAEQDEFEREVLRLRHDFAKLKLDYELRRFQQKYSPDQPRVPAGNPDGGQWTSGGGSGADRSAGSGRSESVGPVLSDESPDPIRPGAQYAQARVTIDTSALTGIERIDKTTAALMEKLKEIADIVPKGVGPAYGRAVHEMFKMELRLGAVAGVEVGDLEPTFGGTGRYGSKDSIRPDVVLRDETGTVIAIYDVKTGSAKIDPPRAEEFRSFTRPSVPVIELHIIHGVSRKYLHMMRRMI